MLHSQYVKQRSARPLQFLHTGLCVSCCAVNCGLPVDEGRVGSNVVGAIAGFMEKLQTHSSAILGTHCGPTSWSALWAFPAPSGGKPTRLPILMEMPDMAEEEIDVQEACDAGLVDREDLVDEASESWLPFRPVASYLQAYPMLLRSAVSGCAQVHRSHAVTIPTIGHTLWCQTKRQVLQEDFLACNNMNRKPRDDEVLCNANTFFLFWPQLIWSIMCTPSTSGVLTSWTLSWKLMATAMSSRLTRTHVPCLVTLQLG